MAHHLKFMMVLACCLLGEVTPRPAETEYTPQNTKSQMRSLQIESEDVTNIEDNINTGDILDKIKKINAGLTKPERQQLNLNNNYGDLKQDQIYILDNETLKKLQYLINGKNVQNAGHSSLPGGDKDAIVDNKHTDSRNGFSRAINPYLLAQTYYVPQNQIPTNYAAVMPYSYNGVPAMVVPLTLDNTNKIQKNTAIENSQYLRQTPTLPFQVPWPLAPFFPILIKDPLLTFLHGGGFNNLFEYGQTADVCTSKQTKRASKELDDDDTLLQIDEDVNQDDQTDNLDIVPSRQSRALKKRTIPDYSQKQDVESRDNKKSKKVLKNKIIKKRPVQEVSEVEDEENDNDFRKGDAEGQGDLRWPFGEFGWFGNKKPVAPSPGFFINRLKVRRGGVAIAGPGGVATAGRGGTAIVGPGGLAYTQPGGLAIAGPSARVIALSGDTDMSSLVSRLHQAHVATASVPRKLEPLEGKLVATGPVVYYHKTEQT